MPFLTALGTQRNHIQLALVEISKMWSVTVHMSVAEGSEFDCLIRFDVHSFQTHPSMQNCLWLEVNSNSTHHWLFIMSIKDLIKNKAPHHHSSAGKWSKGKAFLKTNWEWSPRALNPLCIETVTAVQREWPAHIMNHTVILAALRSSKGGRLCAALLFTPILGDKLQGVVQWEVVRPAGCKTGYGNYSV